MNEAPDLRPDPAADAPKETSQAQRWAWPAAGAAALVLAVAFFRGRGKEEAPKGADPAARPVAVGSARARRGDLDLNLAGLGTVTAQNTATVRSRVDGQLLRVAFKEGQAVRAGELLAELDPRPFQVQLAQAEGQLAKDQAALQNARADLARLQALIAQGIVSRQQLDTQEAAVSQFEAALRTDRGTVDSARLNLTYARITAPIPGRTGLRLVDPGNIVHGSDPGGLVVITQMQPITAVFTLPSDQLPQVLARIKEGGKGGSVPVEAWDRDFRTKLASGTLLAVDNQVDPATGTVRLKAVFRNEDEALFPNQFVNVRLAVDTLKGAVLAPSAAVQRSPQSTYVYVVKPDSTVEMRTVEVRAVQGDLAAFGSGLEAGETVVTEGLDKLRPGAKVSLPGEGGGKGQGKGR